MFNLVRGLFLSRTLRILLVLLVSVSCFTCVVIVLLVFPPVKVAIPLVVLNVTIFLHHWYAMTKREMLKEKPQFGSLVDVILTMAECTAVLVLHIFSWPISPYETYIVNTFSAVVYVQVVCLCLLWVIRFAVIVAQAIKNPSGVVTKPFDFYAMTKDSNKPSIYRIVSGVTISHDRHGFVFAFRRAFTIVIALTLLAFSFTNLVLEPVEESGRTPQKIYTTKNPANENIFDDNWSIFVFARNATFGDESKLRDAINVNVLRDDDNATIDPFCAIRNLEQDFIWVDAGTSKMVAFDCSFGVRGLTKPGPDLLITVNFTTLGINPTFPSNSILSAVSIVVGLHENLWDVLDNTLAIPLVPNAHLLGGVIPSIREQFERPGLLASLGLFSSKKVFYTCAVPFLSPDPSLQVPRDNNTATLRLYLQDDQSAWRVSVEYREKSVLGGISAVGGIWTVLNGLFATIFGTTLLFVLFGSKPLSRFGLIHKIPKFRPVLDDEPDGRYRNLLSESQSDQGMLDYVRDHFVDLGPFEDNRAFNESPNPGTTSPDLTSH